LLCRNHHQMFDMDNLSIGEDLRIKYVDPERLDGPYSTMDEDMSVSIHGEKMRVPSDPRLRPDPMLIAARALDHSE